MKYLSSQPFTIAVSSPRPRSIFDIWKRNQPTENDRKRGKPHEYINGGSMCGLCGLDEKAKIHCQHPFETRMVECEVVIVDGERRPKTKRHFCGECGCEL